MPATETLREKLRQIWRWDWDASVAYGMLTGLRALFVGPVTGLLVATWFSAALQGYYYVFRGLLTAALAAELGLNLVVVPFISHEWVQLGVDEQERVKGEALALSRWRRIGRGAISWYLVISPLMTLSLLMLGVRFMQTNPSPDLSWEAPWLCVCALSGLDFLTRPFHSILEGCQRIELIFRTRLWQGLLSAVATWIAILAGAGLWCLPVGVASSLLVGLAPLIMQGRLLGGLRQPPQADGLAWFRTVWPMQWRIGLSSVAALSAAGGVVPLVFYYTGPTVAGQFGMSLALAQLVVALMGTWGQTRAPHLSELVARQDSRELHRLLYRLALITLATGVVASLAVLAGLELLHLLALPLERRLLPAGPTAVLLAGHVLSTATLPFGLYLRAHRQEPYLGVSLLYSASLLALVTGLTPGFGALGAAWGYLLSSALTLPCSLWVWHRWRRRLYPLRRAD